MAQQSKFMDLAHVVDEGWTGRREEEGVQRQVASLALSICPMLAACLGVIVVQPSVWVKSGRAHHQDSRNCWGRLSKATAPLLC